MHWNEFYEQNEMIEGCQAWPSRKPRDFSTKITLAFHSHYRGLLPSTKRAVSGMSVIL